jgi:hypothetical protein
MLQPFHMTLQSKRFITLSLVALLASCILLLQILIRQGPGKSGTQVTVKAQDGPIHADGYSQKVDTALLNSASFAVGTLTSINMAERSASLTTTEGDKPTIYQLSLSDKTIFTRKLGNAKDPYLTLDPKTLVPGQPISIFGNGKPESFDAAIVMLNIAAPPANEQPAVFAPGITPTPPSNPWHAY